MHTDVGLYNSFHMRQTCTLLQLFVDKRGVNCAYTIGIRLIDINSNRSATVVNFSCARCGVRKIRDKSRGCGLVDVRI